MGSWTLHLQVQVEPLSAHLLPGRMIHLHEMLHFCRITWQPGASARCGHLLSCLRFLSHLVLCCGDGTRAWSQSCLSQSQPLSGVSETATAKQQLDSLLVGFQQVFYG